MDEENLILEKEKKNEKQINKKIAFVLAVILLLGIGFFVGRYFGLNEGKKIGEEKAIANYEWALSKAFPKPPAVLNSVNGVVKNIKENKITIEFADPEDYIPHKDGSPRRMISRGAIVTPQTAFYVFDYSKNEGKVELKGGIKEVRLGDVISVKTSQNILRDINFIVGEVVLLRY